MPYIPPTADSRNLMHLYAFGVADPPQGDFSIKSIEEIAAAFLSNILRLKSMMAFPAFLADFTSQVQRMMARAEFEQFGEFIVEERFSDGPTAKALFEKFRTLFSAHTAKLASLRNDPEKLSKLVEDMVEKGGAVTVMLADTSAAENNFDLAMMSILTSAWTTFETAAGDLWEAALNNRPFGLANLGGDKRYKGKRQKRADDDTPKNDKSVRLDVIRDFEWDTRNKMGSILRTKFSFTALWGIREAYEAAFYKKSDGIDQIIMRDCFDRLSALRNLIVHKSAVADAEYLKQARDFPTLPQLSKGEQLRMDGKIVAGLVNETMHSTFGLLKAVEQWLIDNAPKAAEAER